MKYILKSNDIRASILELIAERARVENKWMNAAKTQREEGAHARAKRVLSELYEDVFKAEVE